MDRRDIVVLVLALIFVTGCCISKPIMDAFGEIPDATEVTIEESETIAQSPESEEIIEQTEIKGVALEDIKKEVIEIQHLHKEVEEVIEEPVEEAVIEEPVEEAVVEEFVEEPVQNKTYYGACTITHYCNCAACCGQWAGGNTASGVPPQAGVTVASGDLPFGTVIEVNGHQYTVQDRGVSGMWIDIYCSSHEEALQRGMYTADVYIVN